MKIKKIINAFAENSKDEDLEKEHSDFEEFLEHCSISGEILELIISTVKSNSNYLRKVLVNQTLTTNQIITLLKEVKKHPKLAVNPRIRYLFSTHKNSTEYIKRAMS